MVYKGKCKHLGCTVGFNAGLGGSKDVEDYDEDGANDGRILCPCHQGQYDIYDLARNVPGTPPPAPLDVIRFNIGDFGGDTQQRVPAASDAIIGGGFVNQSGYREADLDGDGAPFALGTQALDLEGA
jgi:nitrite reductase/ring-hydroxylating ferredoxin subunit